MKSSIRQFELSPTRGWQLCLLNCIAFAGSILVSAACAEDTVYLRGEAAAERESKATGEILDYTGREITVRSSLGQEKAYAASRVIRVESTWTKPHEKANQAYAAGDFRTAGAQYKLAVREEQRAWVRRLILSQLVYCYQAVGEPEAAAEQFLALIASDPSTPYFACIPLNWTAGENIPPAKVSEWLAQVDQPATLLLGCSYALAGPQRATATELLKALARQPDPRIAALATAQLWRTLVFQAELADVDRWEEMISNMPAEVQGGPYFVLGSALARLQQRERAVLALLRPAILYPQDRTLAAQSLLTAADELAALDRTEDAGRLYREVVASYPGTRAVTTATSRLQKLPE